MWRCFNLPKIAISSSITARICTRNMHIDCISRKSICTRKYWSQGLRASECVSYRIYRDRLLVAHLSVISRNKSFGITKESLGIIQYLSGVSAKTCSRWCNQHHILYTQLSKVLESSNIFPVSALRHAYSCCDGHHFPCALGSQEAPAALVFVFA